MTDIKKILFLDLEETVFDDWSKQYSATATQWVDDIKTFIKQGSFDEIRLFSYAMSNHWDIEEFSKIHKNWVERMLECKITLADCFTTGKLYEAYKKKSGYFYDTEQEFLIAYGKQKGFEWFIDNTYENTYAILIDDMVGNRITMDFDKNNTISLINVKDLKKRR